MCSVHARWCAVLYGTLFSSLLVFPLRLVFCVALPGAQFVLVSVVMETAVNKKSVARAQAP